MPEDRRLVAIMFTDIVGYTALMGKDEDKAFKVLRKNREIQKTNIKKYNGKWLKEMGDGILASFHTASDAVRCAGEIQHAAKNEGIQLRIGINEGEVVFEGSDVFGEGVNIASRLEELAEAGSIQISGAVYKDIRNKSGINAELVGEQSLKNIDDPVKIYKITCEPTVSDIPSPNMRVSNLPDKKSIIVLPFDNISPDPDQEYFSDGLTEEIITDLSHIHDLLVISRNSAMTFKGTKKRTKEIAREVNVRYVLEGSVRKAGNNLRIVAQLIDALTDTHLWAEKYSGTLDDVFEIQEKVSRSIADALRLKLTPQESKKIAENTINNIAAYECYLKARQEMHGWMEGSFDKAHTLLQHGVNIIGENDILYAGMALEYIYMYESGTKADEEILQMAEEYIDKVYKLNPESHHYYYLLGRIERFRGNNLNALGHFKNAYIIEKNDPEVLLLYSFHLAVYAGKPDLAEPYINRLIEIDPLTPLNYISPMMYHLIRGETDLAIDSIRKATKLAPFLNLMLARYLMWDNQLDEAFEIMRPFEKESPDNYNVKLYSFGKYAMLGEKEKALQVMNEEAKRYCWNDPDYPWFVAGYYAMIDEKGEAFKWLEHTINRGMINYPLLNDLDPFLKNLRGEQRFKELMAKIKYEWEHFEIEPE
jgi:adenylate cyclase